jgi:uncharacterized membrane protein YeaQ/YmgE (transglycosylase-associated protein family)
MNVFTWIFFGMIVGIIVNAVDAESEDKSLVGASLLGVLGAVLGGFFANLVFGFGVRGFDITAFLLALCGSFLFLSLGRVVKTSES